MSSLSREQARKLIAKIRAENGGISLEDELDTPPAVLEALANVRRKLGAATRMLSTNLYSKDTRFVYELIQNAEDNEYTQGDPQLSFSVYPDKIVIDSNEDGFHEEHVRAICSTGESTKPASQGYIGEKGIGFKSVFKVAKKAHIQSGPFSFSFRYERTVDDGGIGMVTPFDEEFEELPENTHTRITLTLSDQLQLAEYVQDLLRLPDGLLLFLPKLKTLRLNAYLQNGNPMETILGHHIDETDENINIIRVTRTISGETIQEDLRFYVVKKEVEDLPVDDARKHTTRATVVLAFPVTANDNPWIEQQHVFAFLPLRTVGFTFLIHSDFITQASREDVFHNPRNLRLLNGVAETFRKAVVQFCHRKPLKYKWMRYLPSESISDQFWGKLRPKILSLLQSTPCLWSRSRKSLCLPGQLRWLSDWCLDKDGEPLFPDLGEEAYLSERYAASDYNSLSTLGMKEIDWDTLKIKIQADLESPESKMRAYDTEDDWHTRAAKLLSSPFTSGPTFKSVTDFLKLQHLVPLQDGRWVSATMQPIFLPNTKNIPIPTDLGLCLVQSQAVLNPARKTLFTHLGVQSASPSFVVSKINERYRSPVFCTLDNSISHVRYLYWNLDKEASALDNQIFLLDHNLKRAYRGDSIYFEEADEEYGPKKLLQDLASKAGNLTVHFLHSKYLDAVPVEASQNGLSWKQWLIKFAAVQSHPRLRNPRTHGLSNAFKAIIRHRPENLVGLLHRYWTSYETQSNDEIEKALRDAWVPTDGYLADCLKDTYLPLPALKSKIQSLKIKEFPFLIIPKTLNDENGSEWKFLKRFGVIVTAGGGGDGVHFYTTALRRIVDENEGQEIRSDILEAVFKIYHEIEQSCSSQDDRAYINAFFKGQRVIYTPSNAMREAKWVTSDDCVWTAPDWLQSKTRLYGALSFAEREHLFHLILKIDNSNWKHYIDDLKILKQQSHGGNSTTERVIDIYRLLWREFERDSSWAEIISIFENSELVYVPAQKAWHPPSSCIWADDQIPIPRKASIKMTYASLEDFFCRILGIPKPDLKMHVQALKELAQQQTPPAFEFKRTMNLISSMDPQPDDVTDLRRARIFPVTTTDGRCTFTDSTADFAINDRPEYGLAFTGKINILAYSINEVRACRSLFFALRLEGRHLSNLVHTTTTKQGGTLDNDLSRSFRLKAYALYRCAVHYQSPKSRDDDSSLYSKLLDTAIYVSDGIFKSLSVVQYGQTITVENSRANFHLEENDEGRLHLYVPRDEDDREECYFRQFPRGLMTYFEISDPTAEALLNGLIGCRGLRAVNGILRDAGIVEIDGIEAPSGFDQRFAEPELEDAVQEEDSSVITESRASHQLTPASTTARSELSQREEQVVVTEESSTSTFRRAEISHVEHHRAYVPPRSPDYDGESTQVSGRLLASHESILRRSVTESNTAYVAVLDRVIHAGASLLIPARGALSMIPEPVPFFGTAFPTRSMERDRKVGAAGELLVFEMLSNLGLSKFSIDNWTSTIRTEVKAHDKYQNMEAWSGSREKTDLMYLDEDGTLTELLTHRGYLQTQMWEREPDYLNYYIEVKTSVNDLREPFYMSNAQYRLMQSMRLPPQGRQSRTPDVYVLFRVINIEQRIGLRVYVDPEASRGNGELQFEVDKWVVRPS